MAPAHRQVNKLTQRGHRKIEGYRPDPCIHDEPLAFPGGCSSSIDRRRVFTDEAAHYRCLNALFFTVPAPQAQRDTFLEWDINSQWNFPKYRDPICSVLYLECYPTFASTGLLPEAARRVLGGWRMAWLQTYTCSALGQLKKLRLWWWGSWRWWYGQIAHRDIWSMPSS